VKDDSLVLYGSHIEFYPGRSERDGFRKTSERIFWLVARSTAMREAEQGAIGGKGHEEKYTGEGDFGESEIVAAAAPGPSEPRDFGDLAGVSAKNQ
jgi:hypothetical protein